MPDHVSYPSLGAQLLAAADLLLWLTFVAVPVLLIVRGRGQTPARRRVFALLAALFTLGGVAHGLFVFQGRAGVGATLISSAAVTAAAAVVAFRLFPRALAADEADARAEELEQLRLLDAALAASADGVIVAAPNPIGGLEVVYANLAVERLTGYTAEEVVGLSPSVFCHAVADDDPGPADDETDGVEQVRAALRGDVPVRVEVPGRRKDGSRVWAEWHVVPIPGPGGEPGYRVAVLRDTTDRRKGEESAKVLTAELRRRVAQVEALVELCPVGIAVAEDPHGRSVHVNQVLRDLLDLPPAPDPELTPAPVRLQVRFRRDGRVVPQSELPLHRALLKGEAVAAEEYLINRGGGADRVVVASAAPMLDDAGRVRGAVSVFTDLTDRKRLEEQLRQAAKMEAVGRLAGGIAHDFNNLLTVIQGNAELLRKSQPGGDDAELVSEVRLAADRAAGLVRQLLTFSRRQPARPEVLDLGRVVHEMSGLFRRLLGERVTVKAEPDPAPVRTLADRGQVEQVLMNLAVNARDAMPAGGALTIRVGAAAAAGGKVARLTVTDTGCGMTDEVKARIFEPFFTTKGPEGGTGLGLATVFGIVHAAGGAVEVDSAPGAGTTFRIDLPWTDAPATTTTTPAPAETPPPRAVVGKRTVLLVEDEDGVRRLARFALEAHGYAVTEAPDAEAALELLGPAGWPDLLVTDLTMPGMDGRDLAGRVRDRCPRVGVVFTSGYVPDDARLDELPGSVFLPKPFTPADLVRAAGAAVGGSSPAVSATL